MSVEEEFELGSISGVFGVKGEVRLFLHHRNVDLLARTREVGLRTPSGERRTVRIRAREGAGRRIVATLDGVTTREQAEALIGSVLLFRRSDLPKPRAGEFYVADVIGLPVEADGVVVGRVVQVHSTGPTDILEVRSNQGETAFVACVKEAIVSLRPADGKVVVVASAVHALGAEDEP